MGLIKLNKISDFPYMTISLSDTLFNKTGTWRTFKPIHKNKLPPCNHNCPIGENIQRYIDLVLEKKYQAAYTLIKESNPIPSITGRVCYHPCEEKCNRGEYDEPLAIHHIERFLGDYGLQLEEKWEIQERKEKIAIIGSGPAGIACAYHLRRMGYRPKIFESASLLGGMLRVGIPEYRLPKEILDKEIKKLEAMGIEMETNKKIGNPRELLGNFAAVFAATGAHISRKMEIQGEDAEGIIPGLRFLKKLNMGEKVEIGKNVAIIGGGNTAVDAARSALRLGSRAIILYRRSRKEMPALRSEVREAEKEGIEIQFLTAPSKIIIENNRASTIECLRMKLGEPDESGRRRPLPISGSEFKLRFDTIISAIGEKTDFDFFSGFQTTGWGVRAGNFGTTSEMNIFAGGDCVTGPSTVVEALAAGKRAATAISLTLSQKTLPKVEELEPISFDKINLAYFKKEPRIEPAKLSPLERIKNFSEIQSIYDEQTLLKEAARCFSCGVCNSCDNCWVFCPDMAIIKNEEYEINYEYCKGCGICAQECPRGVITMKEEGK